MKIRITIILLLSYQIIYSQNDARIPEYVLNCLNDKFSCWEFPDSGEVLIYGEYLVIESKFHYEKVHHSCTL